MFERKEALVMDKKCFISHDYIRKVFQPDNNPQNILFKDNNSVFQKTQNIQKINISNDQPLVLFHKTIKNSSYKMENEIKKDLIENKGYLNDGGYKKKLMKYYSYHNTDQNRSKNNFFISLSQNKAKNKNYENQKFFNSKRNLFNLNVNKRTIQMDYSNSIRKLKNRPKIKKKKGKENENKLFNSINVKDVKFRNLLIKKLTNENIMKKNLMGKIKSERMSENEIIKYKRKKEYLEQNSIPYEKDSEKINENINNKKLQDIKDLKLDDKRITNSSKKDNNKINDNEKDCQRKTNIKKRYKDIVNPFEYIKKIRSELNNLRNSREKNEVIKSAKKN